MKGRISPNKCISLKEASQTSGYHPDYLSYLIREKKLEGKRVSRDWFTTEEAVKNYISSKKFILIKDFLLSKINPKLTLGIIGALILIGISAFLILKPQVRSQQVPGDFFETTELQAKEIKLPTYLSE